ncbi:MAG TPA: permease-like cell division protein FtsX [Candidatus Saccharimonadales bacterium]|nr:permease-like cell division protein FtsX [Candidatus Saccharimonadales bacterium]
MKQHRKLITFGRIIKTGLTNFLRNAWLAAAAMAVMTVTLTIVLFSVVTSATFNNTIQQINAKINVSIYLADSTTLDQANVMMQQLRTLPEVKQVSYISKDQALAIFTAGNSTNLALQQAINQTGNPLPASLKVMPQDPSHIASIEKFIKDPKNVALEDPQNPSSYHGDQKAAVDKIAHATNVMRQAGVVAVAVFAIISMLIIFNTIQMAIFNRRDELTIMRLLGASTSFIRGPFVVESIMYGVISAFISVAIIDVLFIASSSALQASSLGLLDINYSNTYFHNHFWMLLGMQLAVGIIIGAGSSILATRRYLKFKTK